MDSYGQDVALTSHRPFLYFCRRMQVRWRLRCVFRVTIMIGLERLVTARR